MDKVWLQNLVLLDPSSSFNTAIPFSLLHSLQHWVGISGTVLRPLPCQLYAAPYGRLRPKFYFLTSTHWVITFVIKFGIISHPLQWLCSFLSSQCKVSGCGSTCSIWSRARLRCHRVLGPLLYILYAADLSQVLFLPGSCY